MQRGKNFSCASSLRFSANAARRADERSEIVGMIETFPRSLKIFQREIDLAALRPPRLNVVAQDEGAIKLIGGVSQIVKSGVSAGECRHVVRRLVRMRVLFLRQVCRVLIMLNR